jgi:hypothetical protein
MKLGNLTGKNASDSNKSGEAGPGLDPTAGKPTSDTSTDISGEPEKGPTPDTGDKPLDTTNTTSASQVDSATTTDLDPLTQYQVGDNLDASATGRNAQLSAGASDSATRQQTLSEVSQERAAETADAGLEAQMKRQDDNSGSFDAGGNTMLGLGEMLARATAEGDSDQGTSYTSHPTKTLKLGRFQFENSTLTLKGDDVAEFDELLDKQPAFVKNGVKKIDTGAANKLAKQFLDQNRMIQGIDNAGNGPTKTVGSSI